MGVKASKKFNLKRLFPSFDYYKVTDFFRGDSEKISDEEAQEMKAQVDGACEELKGEIDRIKERG